jgi:hypothetical protein
LSGGQGFCKTIKTGGNDYRRSVPQFTQFPLFHQIFRQKKKHRCFKIYVSQATSKNQSPKTNHQKPITKNQSPKTNHQKPITKNQSPKTCPVLK